MKDLKPCPFCGGEADILVKKEEFEIVGCTKKTMLCPMPSITVYKDENGNYEYKYWNNRQ